MDVLTMIVDALTLRGVNEYTGIIGTALGLLTCAIIYGFARNAQTLD